MEELEKYKIVITAEEEGKRLDKIFADHIDDISRSKIQKLIEEGHVEPKRPSKYKVLEGEEFQLFPPEEEECEAPKAEHIPLDVIYEDDYLLVINKSSNMVVHPGAGNNSGTLVNALLYKCGAENLSTIGGIDRPGIVHRLDKETSGLMLVAKNDEVHKALTDDLAERKIKRTYNAVVWGVLPESGKIEANIGRSDANRQKMAIADLGGKEAVTEYSRIKNYGIIASLAECRLQTGRTHQIRVHMAHINHWVVGDPTYAKSSLGKFFRLHKLNEKVEKALREFPRQALHAVSIEFTHPIKKDNMVFRAELPADMQELVNILSENIK